MNENQIIQALEICRTDTTCCTCPYYSMKAANCMAELTSDALSAVKQGMKQMIANSSTASYYMRNVPVVVGGKTGTAQRGGDKLDNGLFVCAAPYDNPKIVVSSVIESSGSGALSTYAASRVVSKFFN
jgi:penicillin-binding protein 2